jgi:hypothetical protein
LISTEKFYRKIWLLAMGNGFVYMHGSNLVSFYNGRFTATVECHRSLLYGTCGYSTVLHGCKAEKGGNPESTSHI